MKASIKKTIAALSLSMSIAALAAPAYAADHTVKPNDTLWKISKANQLSLQSVLAANPGVNPYNLQAGRTVKLPDTVAYTIKDGDTFWLLSQARNIPLWAVLAVNPNANPGNLIPGQTVRMPVSQQGDKVTAQAVTPTPKAAAQPGNTITTAAGEQITYNRVINVVATAYSSAHEENGWGPVDFIGNPLELGTIAVDPNVIPMGSKVYITGYSSPDLPAKGMIARATDQGSAIKGNRVDIFLPGSPESVSHFGIQNVKLYVLK